MISNAQYVSVKHFDPEVCLAKRVRFYRSSSPIQRRTLGEPSFPVTSSAGSQTRMTGVTLYCMRSLLKTAYHSTFSSVSTTTRIQGSPRLSMRVGP